MTDTTAWLEQRDSQWKKESKFDKSPLWLLLSLSLKDT